MSSRSCRCDLARSRYTKCRCLSSFNRCGIGESRVASKRKYFVCAIKSATGILVDDKETGA